MAAESSDSNQSNLKADQNTDIEAQATSPTGRARGLSGRDDSLPGLRRARTTFNKSPRRSVTSHQYNPNSSRGRRWQPGEEPGIDPNKLLPGGTPHLQSECEITLVSFSQEEPVNVSFYDNQSIIELLDDLSKADKTHCKWVNVNGLSWDVISALAKAKKFHSLAIEDVLSRKNRTKVDWYSDQAYVVLPLQKLIHVEEEEEDTEEQPGFLRRTLGRKGSSSGDASGSDPRKTTNDPIHSYEMSTSFAQLKRNDSNVLRSLQRYHGGPNEERIEFMEQHRALKDKSLNVSVEQVSIFLMSDNMVVSFFEHSAEDIESPILSRLDNEDTVLRRSNDASMMLQAILDGIIDLSLPVCTAYQDSIDELELNVLTSPSIQHTNRLYVLQSEVSQFRANIAPVLGLIDALRDHSNPNMVHSFDPSNPSQPRPVNLRHNTGATSAVFLTPAAKVYLADVADHVTVVSDSLEQMRRAAENMSSYIFNTISAWQNESMRQLTNITIIFLPLTFITGYFGQNFTYFDGAHNNSDAFFWAIALPVVFVLATWVLRDGIIRWFKVQKQRLGIRSKRKKRGVKMQ